VIVTGPGGAPEAAKAATTTIPIVFYVASDPVRLGLVTSLNRPDGNLTGVTIISVELGAKRFGLLREMVPQTSVIHVLRASEFSNSISPATAALDELQFQELQEAGRIVGLPIRVVTVENESGFDDAFASMARERTSVLFVPGSSYMLYRRRRLVELAARYRIPASYANRPFAEAGGLMSYGADASDAWRHVGRYTGRIVKGEKPMDLPVMLPTKYEFIINLKTAKELGLTIPPGVLAIADEVIE
jgi:putative tryptophan/tyrosine transport system substrate-binding protein